MSNCEWKRQESKESRVKLSPKEQQEIVWKSLVKHNCPEDCPCLTTAAIEQRRWPTYDLLMSHLSEADYRTTLTCPLDVLKDESTGCGCTKAICPYGVVCCAKLELFPVITDNMDAYTGLLTPGTTVEHCILRLSTAVKPPKQEITSTWGRTLLYAAGRKLRNAQLFPSAAIKVFRQDVHSGNLLFGGSKVGQRETDYFHHCQCTSMTEQMPRPVKPFVRKFWQYSDYPLSLGISDFCRYTIDGEESTDHQINFPFALILKPRYHSQHERQEQTEMDSFDGFLDEVLSVPPGTHLFDLFACPDPLSAVDGSKLQRIGRISSTSDMIQSAPNDSLFFRHQKKEEDYALRPEWPEALGTAVTIDDGRTRGTIGKLAGWKLFEQHIAAGGYLDFESTQQI